jgi:hypothetical protein
MIQRYDIDYDHGMSRTVGRYCKSSDVEELEKLNSDMLDFISENCCSCDNCCKEMEVKLYEWKTGIKTSGISATGAKWNLSVRKLEG